VNFLPRFLYNAVLTPLLFVLYRIYALFNDKAKESLRGRKKIFDKIAKQIAVGRVNLPAIWFHCSSVGEFEQARPIITALKDKARIVVSFFSPSGYNLASKYPHADLVCYLPFDTVRNACRMFQLIKPVILVFVKFDVWPNYVWTAAEMHVPVMLVDATLHKESKELLPIVRWFLRSVHKCINLHCAISESDAQKLRRICPDDAVIKVTGDTRFDQVIFRRNSAVKKLEGLLPQFQLPVIIAGSTYTEDERVVIEAYQKVLTNWGSVQLILVPHEPEPDRLEEIEALMSKWNLPHIRLADLEKKKQAFEKGLSERGTRGTTPRHEGEAIIVDRVGVLAELYLLGDITFIGGSFHGSVHNVMEPAVMGKPVLFGPTIQNSLEAAMLMERRAGIMVKNSEEMASELIKLLSNDELRQRLGKSAQTMIEENAGATEKIVACINEFLQG